MAEGRSNQALVVTLRSAETCVSRIFTKLDLPNIGGEYRRVPAVLEFLQS